MVCRTVEQQHYFNCPYQLGTGSNDLPSHGNLYAIDVKDGDLVIMASDGLWDNLFDEEILKLIAQTTKNFGEQCNPQLIATALAKAAMEAGHSEDKMSPFAVGAEKAGVRFYGGKKFIGGKLDDVTVLVARVTVGEGGKAKL